MAKQVKKAVNGPNIRSKEASGAELFCYYRAMSKRIIVKTIACLLVFTPLVVRADAEDTLLKQVYVTGGKTLYCQTEFKPGDRLKVDYVYSEKQLLRHFNCITSRQCASKDGFELVVSDLHNMYPVERQSELDRRGTLLGDLPDNVEAAPCGYQLSFQTFDPSPHAKGNIARAMVYMHKQHGLPLIGALPMYKRWNEEDPPDEAEKQRNASIGRIQGNRNPYIDDPDLLENMSGF